MLNLQIVVLSSGTVVESASEKVLHELDGLEISVTMDELHLMLGAETTGTNGENSTTFYTLIN